MALIISSNKLVLAAFFALVAGMMAVDAVSNCFFCDINISDCKNSANWVLKTCNSGALGNDTPCYKIGKTGNRGCATYPACSTSNNVRDYEFDWAAPWLWVWNQILPTWHDCFSQSHGCHDFYCCRDQDRCNSATSILPGSTPLAVGALVLPLAFAAVALY